MVNDPVADMFSRINNASRAGKATVLVPYSKLKIEIAKLLEKRGLVGEVAKRGKKNRRNIELKLFYDEDGSSRIEEIKRVSKPSRRIYKGWRDLRPLKRGLGFYIISTPAGLIDDKQAKHLKVGGEILGEAR
ncbi:MAG: 30S ribosomal protein S8 [Candidatus Niyogibacteria bacterium]|nr:30S ribosomal protein S8 [Candidatus Niyogibacteria bacterium]